MDKPSVSIIDALGETRLEALGVGPRTIRHARYTGTFAAGWYRQIKAACDDAGVPCPLVAFNWKVPAVRGDAA